MFRLGYSAGLLRQAWRIGCTDQSLIAVGLRAIYEVTFRKPVIRLDVCVPRRPALHFNNEIAFQIFSYIGVAVWGIPFFRRFSDY